MTAVIDFMESTNGRISSPRANFLQLVPTLMNYAL